MKASFSRWYKRGRESDSRRWLERGCRSSSDMAQECTGEEESWRSGSTLGGGEDSEVKVRRI